VYTDFVMVVSTHPLLVSTQGFQTLRQNDEEKVKCVDTSSSGVDTRSSSQKTCLSVLDNLIHPPIRSYITFFMASSRALAAASKSTIGASSSSMSIFGTTSSPGGDASRRRELLLYACRFPFLLEDPALPSPPPSITG
ncbi:hypothetical protein Taro_034365, partial [Colocasia esculenta]|nr:hypothetical protein [Colocasia esculenta]